MTFLRGCLVAGATLMIGACSSLGIFGVDRDQLAGMQPQGGPFNAALHKEYLNLADLERDEQDWADANYFYDRSLAAASGNDVVPTKMDERSIPAAATDDLVAARERLVAALFGGGKEAAPAAAGRAQAAFDCWMQEQEEDIQPDHIAACRDSFELAMGEVDTAMKPAETAEPAAPAETEEKADDEGIFIVFFDFDSAEINAKAQAVIDSILENFRSSKPSGMEVTGHTDRAGSQAYNEMLASQRAIAVTNALIEGGVPRDTPRTVAVGERLPLLPTDDGIREQRNRRVEVIFD